MRKVKVYKYTREEKNGVITKVFDYEAKFHEFGVDYEEFEDGAGNYSTAIVERENGKVESVPIDMIAFVNPEEE